MRRGGAWLRGLGRGKLWAGSPRALEGHLPRNGAPGGSRPPGRAVTPGGPTTDPGPRVPGAVEFRVGGGPGSACMG